MDKPSATDRMYINAQKAWIKSGYIKEDTYTLIVDRTFPARFKMFLADIQASDQMGEEELNYLRSYQDKFTKTEQ
jgi:hypothetical protein